MSLQLIKSNFHGNEITFNNDGWFDATSAAAKFGKRPVDWLNLESTKEYIEALCDVDRSEKSSLLKIKRGGKGKSDATWFSPKLAVSFARWLDVKFGVWCDKQIDSIIRGTIDQKRARHEVASSFKVMQSVLQLVREEQGKITESHHYSNEARLINFALSGKFQSIDRDTLTFSELNQLAKLEEKNSVLIGRGVDYKTRKTVLEQHAIDLRISNDSLKLAA